MMIRNYRLHTAHDDDDDKDGDVMPYVLRTGNTLVQLVLWLLLADASAVEGSVRQRSQHQLSSPISRTPSPLPPLYSYNAEVVSRTCDASPGLRSRGYVTQREEQNTFTVNTLFKPTLHDGEGIENYFHQASRHML